MKPRGPLTLAMAAQAVVTAAALLLSDAVSGSWHLGPARGAALAAGRR
jgi:hypothetical protein